jgi:glycosyltransferase involved in cell wall biosynthesis
MIKVLHFVAGMDYGGIESWLMHVLRHIDRKAFQMDFCTTAPEPGAYAPEIESLGGKIVPCPLSKSRPMEFGRRFRSILAKGQYEIVHSHAYLFSGFVVRLAYQAGVRCRIAHSHSVADGKASSLPRALYRGVMKHWVQKYATQGLAASEDSAQALFGKDWRADPRYRVLHCGIELACFRQPVDPSQVRQELGLSQGVPVIGHVGRFVAAKNHRFLLDVAREVIRIRPQVQFLLVGDGPLRPEIQAHSANLGIDRNVVFAGQRSDVPRLMLGAMDAFLLPSQWEGLGMVLLEAQAAGLCSVASDAIPAEVRALPSRITSLPLALGAERWAATLIQALGQERLPSARALEVLAGTDFSIEKSCSSLTHLYGSIRVPEKMGEPVHS